MTSSLHEPSAVPSRLTGPDAHPGDDPYLWLEDVEGEAALAHVRAENARAEAALTASPRFAELRDQILEVLDSDDRIPMVVERGGLLYNFWTDAAHERGLWRRTTMESYRTPAPDWEVLLDVDALNAAEGSSWVWKGADVLYPDHRRALVRLSPGGSDADVVREFDLETKSFVEDGFRLPLSKGGATWADSSGSAIFVGRDMGEGTLTASGYPRTVRRWSRGSALADAPEVFAGEVTDVGVTAGFDATPGFERSWVLRLTTFYTSELHLVRPDGSTVRLAVPDSAEADLHREWLTVLLREPWELPHLTHDAGTLLGIRLNDFLRGSRDFAVLFEPTPTTSLVDVTWTLRHLVLTVLDDVRHRVDVLTPPAPAAPAEGEADGDADEPGTPARGIAVGVADGPATPAGGTARAVRAWRRRPFDAAVLAAASAQGDAAPEGDAPGAVDDTFLAIDSLAVAPRTDDRLWITTSGYLTPTTLSIVDLDETGTVRDAETLKRAPAHFDASGLSVSQHFVLSDDGTRVPYFEIRSRSGAEDHGPAPTLLYGYGGFEIPMLPAYSGGAGRAWLTRGGTYVVANIRGGGEYGPRWHRAALREHRHRAYEDFAAVARDLVDRGVTTREQLGIQGGSNGGLLMGNMLTTYPELFGAVVCQVPLLDMRRYSHLLAGASWVAEYGDPDEPADWRFLQRYSPYHRVDRAADHPPVLFTTSTRDDRVHPGHARKMAALLRDAGKDVLSWENIEGGHGGAASNAQRAMMNALAFEFLWQRLG